MTTRQTQHNDFGIRAKHIDTAKPSKTQQIKDHLLSGRTITGLQMMMDYGCASYRDVIYHLRQKGMNIKSEMVGGDNRHAIYWLADDTDNPPLELTTEGAKA